MRSRLKDVLSIRPWLLRSRALNSECPLEWSMRADFDEERLGSTAQELLTELEAWRPVDESRALTHGDPCLPNVLFDKGQFVGFIDCDRVGVADPYQDLALAARSIGSNLGRSWVPVFFRQYGIDNPNERKLAFYRLLDEFF